MTTHSTSDLVARRLGAVGGVAILSLGMLPKSTPAAQDRARRGFGRRVSPVSALAIGPRSPAAV